MYPKSTHRVKLNSIIQAEGEKFQYEYDFGDGWQHEILIEKILPADPEQKLPMCLTGKRVCPPEGSGGVYLRQWMQGYQQRVISSEGYTGCRKPRRI